MISSDVQKVTALTIAFLLTLSACKDNGKIIEPPLTPPCDEAILVLSRLTTIRVPPPPGFVGDSITCPRFILGPRPYHLGDTLVIIVSQAFGAAIIGANPVYVTTTSKFGDSETYWLRGGSWPCESRATDVEIYRAVIFYNTAPLGGPPYPSPNNGLLEVRTTGDTLVASYVSYCTGNTIRDTVAILPREPSYSQ